MNSTKHILALFLSAFSVLLLGSSLESSAAVTNVEAVVTFTNVVRGVTNGDSITINGDTRRYTNGTLASSATWIRSTNTVGGAATNTWLHLGQYAPLGVDYVNPTNTNAIIIASTFKTNTLLTVSVSSGVGTVFYRTNIWADVLAISAPNSALPTPAGRTNNASRLIELLNDNRQTNAVANGVAALSNLLDRISQQTSSNKVFYATTNSRGLVDYSRLTNTAGIHGSNAVIIGANLTAITNIAGTNAALTNVVLQTVSIGGLTGASGIIGLLTNGALQNVRITNGLAMSLTNVNGVATNLIVYSGLRSEGTGANSLQLGSNAAAVGLQSIAIGNSSVASNSASTAVGIGAIATNADSVAVGTAARTFGQYSVTLGKDSQAAVEGVALGFGAAAYASNSIAIGVDSVAADVGSIAITRDSGAYGFGSVTIGGLSYTLKNYGLALGYGAASSHSNSAAIGPQDSAGTVVATTTTNQIRVGTALQTVSIPGQLLVSGSQSNTTFRGTNIAGGAWAFPRFDLSTLAAGNNLAVPIGTNRFVRMNAGPASAATVCGMVGAATSGGIDGQDVIVFNDTGYTLTFAVNTVDPVPANRINTPSGSDVALANQGWASFIYDATDARWKLINVYQPTVNSVAVSTNAVSMLTASTNINFGNGLTGYVSGATAHIGVSVAGSVSGGSGNGAWVYTGETTLTESAATSFVLISCGSGKYSGAKVFLTFKATNGSDWNIRTMEWNVSTYNDGTGITPTTIDSYHGSWAGTFDSTVTSDIAADGTTGYFIRATVTPTGIGSGTTIVAKWHVWVNTDESPLTVTPQ